VKFVPWELTRNRTVFFTFSMFVSFYLAWYIWDSFFYSLLQFIFNQTVTKATYISNNYITGSCFWCLIFGAILHYMAAWNVGPYVWRSSDHFGSRIDGQVPSTWIEHWLYCDVSDLYRIRWWHSCYLLADDCYGCLRLEKYTRYPGYRGSGYHHWQRLWGYCCCRHVDLNFPC
jgi:hypothetical protein